MVLKRTRRDGCHGTTGKPDRHRAHRRVSKRWGIVGARIDPLGIGANTGRPQRGVRRHAQRQRTVPIHLLLAPPAQPVADQAVHADFLLRGWSLGHSVVCGPQDGPHHCIRRQRRFGFRPPPATQASAGASKAAHRARLAMHSIAKCVYSTGAIGIFPSEQAQ